MDGGWWVVGGGWWVVGYPARRSVLLFRSSASSTKRLPPGRHPLTHYTLERAARRAWSYPQWSRAVAQSTGHCFCAQAQADFGPEGASASAGLFVADELHTLVRRDGRRRRLVRCRHVRYTRGLHIMRVFRLLDARSLAQVTSAGSAEAGSHCDAMGGGVCLQRRTKKRGCARAPRQRRSPLSERFPRAADPLS